MGFAEGINAGVRLRNVKLDEQKELDRRRQLQIEANMAGYNFTNDGIELNEVGQLQNDLLTKKLSIQNDMINQQQKLLDAVAAQNNANSIKDFIVDWTSGDFEGAKKDISNNRYLVEKLKNAKTLQYNKITVPNFDDTEVLQKLQKAGVDTSYLEDKSIRNAIARSFFQVYKNDGSIDIIPLDNFIKQTNSIDYMKPREMKRLEKNILSIEAVLNNKPVSRTLAEDDLYKDKMELEKEKIRLDKLNTENSIKTAPDNYDFLKDKIELEKEKIRLNKLNIENSMRWLKQNEYKVLKQIGQREPFNTKEYMKGLLGKFEKGNLFKNKISNDDIALAKEYTNTSSVKTDKSLTKDLTTQFTSLQNAIKLKNEVNLLNNEEIARGAVDTGIQKLVSLFSDKDFEKLPKEDKEKVIKSVKMNTKLGMFLANYVKSISGAQVTNKEFERLRELFSSSNFENIPKLKASISTFADELNNQFRNNAQANLINNPATTLYLVKKYNDLFKRRYDIKRKKRITAINNKTGERIEFLNGKWIPIKIGE